MRPARFPAGAAALALAACLALSCPAAAQEQEQSAFVKALREQNARHLASPPELPEPKRPPTLEREWERNLARESWELGEGPLHVRVTLKKGGPPDGLLYMNPVVTVSARGKEVLRSEGSESFPDNPVFLVQIAEMDPSNPHAEVVFSTYTGGAHCCSDTRVLTGAKDGAWREIEAGLFDGGPLEARDLDGDGRYEFAMRDNAFLYAFGCYACSTAPLQVLRLEDGELIDVSTDPAFRARQVRALADMVEWAADDSDRNGFLAGYVAQKAVLGEGAEAWALMLSHHDPKSGWGLESCAVKRNDWGECPPGRTEMLTYPEALERFLAEAGYDLKK